MLDAVRISGRWVRLEVLARLTARSRGENPPIRRELVRQFCRATHWYNRKGESCLGSANIALNRLGKMGLVQLPPPARQPPRSRPRQLFDDGEAVPVRPRLPASVGKIGTLRLELIADSKDPNHRLWNRLIIREHPLKAAPLVGAQLRYLIRSDEGILGAFGFGPAAFHLACRDSWIGWDRPSQEANRTQVIGLSRFLIRPGSRCANFASRCYQLALSRVADDWHGRYGVRPLLVETYVDRSTQTGKSLAAANWRRVGQSSGRGRSSPTPKVRLQSTKDVWVYPLSPKARERLQHRPVSVVTPRSIFQAHTTASWTEAELDGLDLGHERLERRFGQMLQARWEHPGRSFYASFGDAAGGKAAYRLIENPQAGISFQSLLAPHREQTHRRMAAEAVIVLAQDTTTLSYNTLAKTSGLGPIGDTRSAGQGLLLHSLQAFRTDRIPLGCAWAHVWARPEESDTVHRNEQSVADKESGRWLDAYQAAASLARSMPQSQLVVCGDRESDIFELYDQIEVAPKNLHLLVRAQHDRLLESGDPLWATLTSQPVGGRLQVAIPRNTNRPARTATLELRWSQIEMAPPQVALKKSWQPLKLYAVLARELHPPAGAEPIEWVLITDWKIQTLKLARRMIRWYALRWGIECWHQVLKDVCGVETRQLKSASALQRALVLDMIVAWRALLLCRLGKAHPELPATLHYSAEELAVLEVYREVYKKKLSLQTLATEASPKSESRPPESSLATASLPTHSKSETTPSASPLGVKSSPLSLYQANLLVAMLAGFWGRASDGHPGPDILGRGLMVLSALVKYCQLSSQFTPKPPPGKNPSRKPG